MKVSFNTTRVLNSNVRKSVNVSRTSVSAPSQNYQIPNLISFSGNKLNQVVILTAEANSVINAGGVGTVAQDLADGKAFAQTITQAGESQGFKPLLVMPYYNGQRFYEVDDKGNSKIKRVEVLKKDGKPIFTKVDLSQTEKTVADLTPKEYLELEEVANKKFNIAGSEENAVLYKVKDKDTYLVYTDATAKMKKPYEGGFSYSSNARPLGHADPYAVFNKAFVELMPEVESKGINPRHILLNDPHAAYAPEYMAEKLLAGNEYYKDTKFSYIIHNAGDAYQQKSTARAMFLNFATDKQIAEVRANPNYQKMLEGLITEDEFFGPYVKNFKRADGQYAAIMIPIKYAKNGNNAHISTVSPGYAKALAVGNGEALGIKEYLKELYEQGKFTGILNGLDSPNMNPTVPIGLPEYKPENGRFPAFETFDPAKQSVKEILDIKQKNAANLFERLQEGVPAKFAIGKHSQEYDVIGHIDKKFVDMIKGANGAKKENVDLFVTWGRADEQKGLDLVIDSFRKFAKTEKGKNAVLVMGGPLKDTYLEDFMRNKIAMAVAEAPGRFVFMDGFAPNAVLSSAGGIPIFPSRFAPCELTDLESMRFGGTPIVTGFQGLDDKNFDIRNPKEAARATGFKTQFNSTTDLDSLDISKLDPVRKKAVEEYREACAKYTQKMKLDFASRQLEKDGSVFKYSADEVTKLTEEAVKDAKINGELKKAHKIATDKLIVEDLYQAMTDYSKLSATDKEKMVANALKMPSTWRTNTVLQGVDAQGKPVGQSAAQLYESRHINGESKPIAQRLFEFVSSRVNDAKKSAENAAKGEASENLASSGLNELGKKSKFYNKRVMATFAGIVALGAFGYYLFKPEKTEQKHASNYVA